MTLTLPAVQLSCGRSVPASHRLCDSVQLWTVGWGMENVEVWAS